MRPRGYPKLIVVGFVIGIPTAWADSVSLSAGGNLISFRYAFSNSSPSAVFTPVLGRVRFVGAYQGAQWQVYYPPSQGHPTFLNTLTAIEPGRGYFVQITPGSQVNLTYTGMLPTSSTERVLAPGWNLVGFLSEEDRFWADLLGPDAPWIEITRGLCNGTTFWGFILDNPPFAKDANNNGETDPEEIRWFYESDVRCTPLLPPLRQFVVGQGYWIKAAGTIRLGPQLALWMPSDVNDGNLNNCFEPQVDEDLNGNGVFDHGYTVWDGFDYVIGDCNRPLKASQDTVVFRVPAGAAFSDVPLITQQITVANVGDRGDPFVYGYGGNDSLSFSIGLSPGLSDWLQVEPLTGTVATHRDVVTVSLKAKLDALPIGSVTTGTLTFTSSGGTKSVTVKAIAPPLGGTYEGSVITWLGNAAAEETAQIRDKRAMRVSFSGATGSILKAFTPSLEADVPLTVTAGGSNSFSATGSITIQSSDPNNKFGVTYQRLITLQGMRQNDDPAGFGVQPPLQGTYTETISGFGPNSITWSGKFLLLQRSEP